MHREQLTRRMNLKFVAEESPTGTAGSVTLVPDLQDTFLVMNGDLLTDLDFHALVDFHRSRQAMLTIATHRRHVKIDLGVLEIDDRGQIVNYLEKPEKYYDVSMGIYVYEPAVLNYVTKGQHLDLPDLVLRLIAAGERVCAFQTDCQWLDIGRPDDYALAQELFSEQMDAFTRV